MTAFVCLDFPKFIAVKMLCTLKPYFLADCCKGERRCISNTSSENLQKYAKKTAFRLDKYDFLMAK